MADMEKSPVMLLDELASLDPQARREVGATLRQLSETFSPVRDGKTTSLKWSPQCIHIPLRTVRCHNGVTTHALHRRTRANAGD